MGVDVLGAEPGDVPLGRVDMRGLPFLIGSEPPVRGAVVSCSPVLRLRSRSACWRSGLSSRTGFSSRACLPGHAVGQPVAEYAFHLAAVWPSPPSGSGSRSRWCHRYGVVCRSSPSPTPATATCRVWRAAGARPGLAWWSTPEADPPGTTCGAGRILTRNERSNGSRSSPAALGSSSPASRPATLMRTRSSACRRARYGW